MLERRFAKQASRSVSWREIRAPSSREAQALGPTPAMSLPQQIPNFSSPNAAVGENDLSQKMTTAQGSFVMAWQWDVTQGFFRRRAALLT